MSMACCFLAFLSPESKLFRYPGHVSAPRYDFKNNPLQREKVELGRALFFDPLLSADTTISCASCHSPYNAFAHTDHDLSHGIKDRIGTRNAPALFNLAWQKLFMWDGAVNHLEVQALAPITHPDEMGESIQQVVKKLQQSELYPALFKRAYSDTLINSERILKALAQFQLTLVSFQSKYDSVQAGKAKFTEQEARGYSLFKMHCNGCHSEPLFTNYGFANNGLAVDTSLRDYGRWKITHNPADSLLFKIPSLRNLSYSFPYMHDGRFKKLSQVLNHYTSGIVQHPTLSAPLQQPIALSANEKVDVISFLLTLNDRTFVMNPAHHFPKTIFSKAKE